MALRNDNYKNRNPTWAVWLAGIAIVLGGLFYFLLKRWQGGRVSQKLMPTPPPDLSQFSGLSEEEAANRKSSDHELAIRQREKQAKQRIWRRNILSVFNLSLIGLAVMQLLLRDPLGALITTGTLLLNIGVNVFQEMLSIRRVATLRAQVEPLATVVRSGRARGVPIPDVVPGDILLVQEGDEFPADGKVLGGSGPVIMHPSNLIARTKKTIKEPGEKVFEGSLCQEGWTVYRADTYPAYGLAESFDERELDDDSHQLTSLQRLIDQLLRWMLAIVVVFLVIMAAYLIFNQSTLIALLNSMVEELAVYLELPEGTIISPNEIADIVFNWIRYAVGLIFSLAPSGLFFMIVVAYAAGVADIGKFGALVRHARTVESLAQVSTLCISKGASLTGADVQLEMISSKDGHLALPANHIVQILGSFARSQRKMDFILRAMADEFEGQSRETQDDFYFLSAFGWSAVSFTDPDIRGTYILGLPEIMEPYLEQQIEGLDQEIDGGEMGNVVSRVSSSVRTLFRRDSKPEKAPVSNLVEGEPISNDHHDPMETANPEDLSLDQLSDHKEKDNQSSKWSIRKSLSRIGGLLRWKKPELDDVDVNDDQQVKPSIELTFAYVPELHPIFNDEGQPEIPIDLTPLCKLTFIEQMRPEARQVVEMFTEAGVKVKILATEEAARVEQLGIKLGWDLSGSMTIVSGKDLVDTTDEEIEKIVGEESLFCELSAGQKESMIKAMKKRGEYIAMVGESDEDVAALNQSQVRITSLRSHRSAMQITDIVMLSESIESLTSVFQKGQRIVNGLMSALNINLIQISYIMLLLMAFIITPPRPFYYDPSQSGMIVFFGVVLPGIGLTIWAPKGRAPRHAIGRLLARFVIPAGITMSVAVLSIFYLITNLGLGYKTAQLAVTHGLVSMGLIIALFAQPPGGFWTGGKRLSGDKRISLMVLVIFILWMIFISIPLVDDLFNISWLDPIWLHIPVAVIVVIWLFIVRSIWRTTWIDRLFKIQNVELDQ